MIMCYFESSRVGCAYITYIAVNEEGREGQ